MYIIRVVYLLTWDSHRHFLHLVWIFFIEKNNNTNNNNQDNNFFSEQRI
jgi:hypothetical protein